MGFKLKQEANSSKYRLMGENVSSPRHCGNPGTSPSPRNGFQRRGRGSRDRKGRQEGCPRQRPGGGKNQPSLVNSTGFRVASGFEGGGCTWDQAKLGLQYQVQGLGSVPRVLGSHGATLCRGWAGQRL